MDFNSLVGRINDVQEAFQAQAAHAINLSLTARNWLVGVSKYHLPLPSEEEIRKNYLIENIPKEDFKEIKMNKADIFLFKKAELQEK